MAHSPGPPAERAANGCRFASYIPKEEVGPYSGGGWDQRWGFLPDMAAPWHPPAGPDCFVFWADRGPGASCPYGEGPRRALVTFPRWKVTRGQGGAAPQSYLQARFNVSRRRRLLDRDGAAPQSYLQARFDVSPPQAAFGPGWRSAPQISSNKYRHPQPAGGSHGGLALRSLNVRRRCPPFLLTGGGRAC